MSLFIRVGLCNLSCVGFGVKYQTNNQIKFGCDSYYSVDKVFKKQWKRLNAKQILSQLKKLSKVKYLKEISNIDIVITGGEPLIYWQNKQFQKLLKKLYKNKNFITIETNGTINIDINKKYQKNIAFSISPKLENSQEPLSKRINYKALWQLLLNNNSYLKFVIKNKDNIKEIMEIKSKLKDCDIYLMPLSNDKDLLELNANIVVNLALEYKFHYSDRLHIRLWNDKQGV